MVRTQVQLTEEQVRALRRLATQRKKSLADLVRQSIELYLAQEAGPGKELRIQRAIEAIGRGSSGAKDVSTNHDKYLAEIYLDTHEPR